MRPVFDKLYIPSQIGDEPGDFADDEILPGLRSYVGDQLVWKSKRLTDGAFGEKTNPWHGNMNQIMFHL